MLTLISPELTTLEQISNYIAKKDSTELVAKFLRLIDKHNLKFLTNDLQPDSSYFLATDLCLSKGLDTKDFVKNYVPNLILTSSKKENSSDIKVCKHKFLAGKFYKVAKDALKRVKSRYQELYSTSLSRKKVCGF